MSESTSGLIKLLIVWLSGPDWFACLNTDNISNHHSSVKPPRFILLQLPSGVSATFANKLDDDNKDKLVLFQRSGEQMAARWERWTQSGEHISSLMLWLFRFFISIIKGPETTMTQNLNTVIQQSPIRTSQTFFYWCLLIPYFVIYYIYLNRRAVGRHQVPSDQSAWDPQRLHIYDRWRFKVCFEAVARCHHRQHRRPPGATLNHQSTNWK